MKKIAIIIENFSDVAIGGEPIIHINFIKYLLKKGYKINIYCQNSEITNSKSEFIVYDNFIQNKNKYMNNISKNNYDFIVASRFGLKFSDISADLYTLHSHSDLYSQKSKFGIFYNVLKPKRKKIRTEINNLKNKVDAKFVFCSEQLKNDYCSLVEIKNAEVLTPYPNCVSGENYIPAENEIFTFGISALGFQNKGGYLALKSAFLLKLFNKKFKLKMIYKKRSGFLPNLLIMLLGLKENVEFLPKQENMSNFYRSIDCLLMPSSLESFGMVAIEAIKHQLPVIISSTSGCKEIITHNKNGFVFDISSRPVWNLFKQMEKVLLLKNNSSFKENISQTTINSEEIYNNTLLNILLNEGK